MSCVVEASPEPTVQWFRGQEQVKAGGRFNLRTEKHTTENSYRLICEINVSIVVYVVRVRIAVCGQGEDSGYVVRVRIAGMWSG